ncbi:DUF3841 domain-containing protein [Nocardioides sp. BYT-33-1]|uniref:DUF3841 domain-containing protein n=1 Tax=Nocardioides sp. BYT-33-1 TaxID=3416952 RepID=UPI003F538803
MLLGYDDLPTRPWWRIVSPLGRGRLGDLTANPLTLWTFQAPDAYLALTETGALGPSPEFEDPDLAHAYPWMRRHAGSRLPTEGRGLLWLWPMTTRRSLREQAKHAGRDVLLTVRMPREHVLLSDFGAWHVVLNNSFHVAPEVGESDDAWWARAEPIIDDWHSRLAASRAGGEPDRDHWPAPLREEAERSWEAIFDSATWRAGTQLQAVAHAVHAEQVVAAVKVRPARRLRTSDPPNHKP